MYHSTEICQDFWGQDPARPRDAGEQRNMKADHAEFLGLGQRLTSGLKGKLQTKVFHLMIFKGNALEFLYKWKMENKTKVKDGL